ARALRFGRAWRTGEDGSVLVPRPEPSAPTTITFVARAGELYGEARYNDLVPGTLWIHVAPDATLTVQVIDHEGAPAAGVDVGWSRRFPGDALPRFGRAGATDAAGRLVLHHTQLQAETWARLDPVGTGSSSIVPYIVGAPHP